ncbi:MAG: thioredoxin domain-containing protein [Planctomycetes bacterium]|nr:thioredoxin domain-containing protein [Planctomycetota bacterium]
MVTWLEWGDEAFAAARARNVPVLLFVRAHWCRWCRELEHAVLADPRVERLLAERFVCIVADKDRRPDIDARYSKGGWPTLAWLDDSGEMLASDTYLEVPDLVRRAEVLSDYYARHRETLRARIADFERESAPPEPLARGGELSLAIVDHVARAVLETADPAQGGWGRDHKFPHPEALDFALLRWSQTGDAEMLQLVVKTLRGMQEGQIHDRIEGGFYRYATRADWSAPHHEKVLDANAQALHVYLEAWQVLGDESFARTARGIIAFLEGTLLDPETRAFRGSQDADPAYANLRTIEERRTRGAPACDATIYANQNAIAVSALFKAASVLGEPRHAERARGVLDFLLAELYDPARGMYHYWDGGYHLPGLLGDQAYVLRALCDAVQHSGRNADLAAARRIADAAIEQLLAPGGGFYDTAYDPSARGGLKRRDRSILENSVMAESLLRLSALTRDPDYADTAREALASFAADYKRHGHFTAGYARAVDLLFHEPIRVTVVGAPDAPDVRELVRAAWKPYVASRIVQVLDPARDAELLQRSNLPASRPGEKARAYVERGRESYAETAEPARLAALMTRVERGG